MQKSQQSHPNSPNHDDYMLNVNQQRRFWYYGLFIVLFLILLLAEQWLIEK